MFSNFNLKSKVFHAIKCFQKVFWLELGKFITYYFEEEKTILICFAPLKLLNILLMNEQLQYTALHEKFTAYLIF